MNTEVITFGDLIALALVVIIYLTMVFVIQTCIAKMLKWFRC